jgi:hypothetical protein
MPVKKKAKVIAITKSEKDDSSEVVSVTGDYSQSVFVRFGTVIGIKVDKDKAKKFFERDK